MNETSNSPGPFVAGTEAAPVSRPNPRKWTGILRSVLSFLIFAILTGLLFNLLRTTFEGKVTVHGFGHGVLHGALMPCAFPNLLLGRDVPIYAVQNTGWGYNLGYVVGVNLCGAFFFGYFGWRWLRSRAGRRP